MKNKILIRKDNDIFDFDILDILKNLDGFYSQSETMKGNYGIKNLKHLLKISNESYELCFEINRLNANLSVNFEEDMYDYYNLNLKTITDSLKNELSNESINIINNHLKTRKSIFDILLDTENNIKRFPVNIYAKFYVYMNFTIVSEYTFSEFKMKVSSEYRQNIKLVTPRDTIPLPNIYESCSLCFGDNLVKPYENLQDYIKNWLSFIEGIFNDDLSYNFNSNLFTHFFRNNLEYVVKHKIQDENLKNAYIEVLNSNIRNIFDYQFKNYPEYLTQNIFRFLYILYLIDVD